MNSLEGKLYQLIIARLDGDKINTGVYRERLFELVHKGIGGFIIFGGDRDAIRDLVAALQTASLLPLFIASDIERGVSQQISRTTSFPCPMALAAAVDRRNADQVSLLRAGLLSVAGEAQYVGINMPLVPVMDVNQDPDNPIICTRAFSDSPSEVAWFGAEYIEAMESTGLISCAKHFPGHGDTSVDSHIALPVIAKPIEKLMATDILPFREAIKAGAGSIMIGHITVPALDTRPASLSERIITGLLRDELGFDGLAITDALNMDALKGFGNVPAACLKAGADILLHPHDAEQAVGELLPAVQADPGLQDRVVDSLNRILKAKTLLNFTQAETPDFAEHTKLSSRITDMSITLVKNREAVLPLTPASVHVVFVGDEKLHAESPIKGHFHCSVLRDTDSIVRDCAVFAVFTSVSAWKGSSGIPEGDVKRINALLQSANRSVVVSFGSPYVLRYFSKAGILIAAYEPGLNAQGAVLKCLSGELKPTGRLPVMLNEN